MASVELQAVIDQLRAHPIDPNAPLGSTPCGLPGSSRAGGHDHNPH
jgi:hypothetical protein